MMERNSDSVSSDIRIGTPEWSVADSNPVTGVAQHRAQLRSRHARVKSEQSTEATVAG